MGVVAALRAFVVWIGRSFFEAVIRSEVTPNQITMAGFAMVLTNCLLYLWHRDMYVLGVGLSLSYTFDALDGAVARRRGMESRFGGYLDSVIDRYQEVAAYIVIGLVQGWWLELYVLTIGCLLISYNKAAAAIQMPVDDKGWPDLMERARRTWVRTRTWNSPSKPAPPSFPPSRSICSWTWVSPPWMRRSPATLSGSWTTVPLRPSPPSMRTSRTSTGGN